MSRLVDLIDAYRDAQEWPPSEAQVARAIGVLPQTVNAWKNRGLKEMPKRETLERLAVLINQPLRVVVDAALVDAKFIHAEDAMKPWSLPPQHGSTSHTSSRGAASA